MTATVSEPEQYSKTRITLTLTNNSTNLATDIFSIDNLFPNPAQDKITLAINNQIESNQVPIQVFDSFGQKIYHETVFLEKGVNALTINTSSFNEGVYLVVLPSGSHQNLVKRFVKMR